MSIFNFRDPKTGRMVKFIAPKGPKGDMGDTGPQG